MKVIANEVADLVRLMVVIIIIAVAATACTIPVPTTFAMVPALIKRSEAVTPHANYGVWKYGSYLEVQGKLQFQLQAYPSISVTVATILFNSLYDK